MNEAAGKSDQEKIVSALAEFAERVLGSEEEMPNHYLHCALEAAELVLKSNGMFYV